ncbi:hypothetical protein SNEBB_006936 [Seison nebaliae]|nr:hypothetical protein SNEBB_006936 [Seison nebaliae]
MIKKNKNQPLLSDEDTANDESFESSSSSSSTSSSSSGSSSGESSVVESVSEVPKEFEVKKTKTLPTKTTNVTEKGEGNDILFEKRLNPIIDFYYERESTPKPEPKNNVERDKRSEELETNIPTVPLRKLKKSKVNINEVKKVQSQKDENKDVNIQSPEKSLYSSKVQLKKFQEKKDISGIINSLQDNIVYSQLLNVKRLASKQKSMTNQKSITESMESLYHMAELAIVYLKEEMIPQAYQLAEEAKEIISGRSPTTQDDDENFINYFIALKLNYVLAMSYPDRKSKMVHKYLTKCEVLSKLVEKQLKSDVKFLRFISYADLYDFDFNIKLNKAKFYTSINRNEDSITLLIKLLDQLREKGQFKSQNVIDVHLLKAKNEDNLENYEDALQTYLEAKSILQGTPETDDKLFGKIYFNCAKCLFKIKRYDDCEKILREAIAIQQHSEDIESKLNSLRILCKCQLETENLEECQQNANLGMKESTMLNCSGTNVLHTQFNAIAVASALKLNQRGTALKLLKEQIDSETIIHGKNHPQTTKSLKYFDELNNSPGNNVGKKVFSTVGKVNYSKDDQKLFKR